VADRVENAGHWFAVVHHLERLSADRLAIGDRRSRRSRAYAELGRWQEAAADFGALAQERPEEPGGWRGLALTQAARGLGRECRQTCERALAALGPEESVLRACLVLPDGVADPHALL